MNKITTFWFKECTYKDWFKNDPQFDKLIKKKFYRLWLNKKNATLIFHKLKPKELLSLVILFDQFPRNMFRGTSKAFSTDSLALKVSQFIISNNLDKTFSKEEKVFLYLPFMHSEDIEMQNISVQLYKKLNFHDYLSYALSHKKEIQKNGRFSGRDNQRGIINEITIVGFGYSGLSVFFKYIDYCKKNNLKNTKIHVYSKENFCVGSAYKNIDKNFLLNVGLERMVISNSLNYTFKDFLNEKGFFKKDTFYYQRSYFGNYLKDLYKKYVILAKEQGISIKLNKKELNSAKELEVNNSAHKVFICIGSQEKSKEIANSLKSIKLKNKPVLILGTGLTAIDTAVTTLKKSKNNTITMKSPSGTLPLVAFSYTKMELKNFMNEIEKKAINLESLKLCLDREFKKYKTDYKTEIEIIKNELKQNKLKPNKSLFSIFLKSFSLEEYIFIWSNLSPCDKKQLKKYQNLFQKIVNPFPLENAIYLEKAIMQNRLCIEKGTLEDNDFKKYKKIYDCSGYIRNIHSKLITDLIKEKQVRLDFLGGVVSKNKNLFILGEVTSGNNFFINSAYFIDKTFSF